MSYIIKLRGEGQDFYLDWSEKARAPLTTGLNLDEFLAYYREQYGDEKFKQLDDLFERLEATGSSHQDYSLEYTLKNNKAVFGKHLESWELFKLYCLEANS